MVEDSDKRELPTLRCVECDYELTGVAGDRCPECGWAIDRALLSALAGRRTSGRRVATIVAALVLGVGSLLATWVLVQRARTLALRDALAVVGVMMAALGHLAIAGTAMLQRARWPLRNRELAKLVLLGAVFSVLLCVAGATRAIETTTATRVVRTVEVTGVMEFVLSAILFTLPGWALLALRLVAFESLSYHREVIRSARRREGESLPGQCPFLVEVDQRYSEDHVAARLSETARRRLPTIEARIESVWEAEQASQAERLLFDGRLARLVHIGANPDHLRLDLGVTTYREFLGTNVDDGAGVHRAGADLLADPLGVSAIVQTADGYLLFGRRSAKVAVHGGYLHCFGGVVEMPEDTPVRAPDPMDEVRREICEELALRPAAIGEVTAMGLVRDRRLMQPELVFETHINMRSAELRARFDPRLADGEHEGIEYVGADPETVAAFLQSVIRMAPVAQAALLLHGKYAWGDDWFEQTCFVLYGELPPRYRTQS